MRDDLNSLLFPVHGEPIDPAAMARKDMQKKLPKRFYKTATAELRDGLHVLLLDGRAAKTPARHLLAVEDVRLGAALVAEWNAQADIINPQVMPLTRLVHSALDGVARETAAVRAEILRYAGSDLTCYRATQPEALVALQAQYWDPVLDFAARDLRARLIMVAGISHVGQPHDALAQIGRALDSYQKPLELAALHVLTAISGSALIALAVAHGFLDADSGFAAAHVDEDYQARVWGRDEEAQARLAQRRIDFATAVFALGGASVA